MVRRIARVTGHRKQRQDAWVELRRSNVPVGVLAVLTGDEHVELHRADQCVSAGRTWRILIETILEEELVEVSIGPGVQSFRALPVEGLVVCDEGRGPRRSVVH